jgi:rSAM/selenodomain-associated transferase 2
LNALPAFFVKNSKYGTSERGSLKTRRRALKLMISVVIPTYNEAAHIRRTIQWLWKNDVANLIGEIIVADAGSTDETVAIAQSEGVRVVRSAKKGRAAQMNVGAAQARERVLYFLHADTLPPPGFSTDIKHALEKKFQAGCYRLSFDFDHWFLKANCWFTRFDVDAIRFGDQSLFVTKGMFQQTGGFCEKHLVLEDQDFVRRLKRVTRFTVLPGAVITSARKYLENGIYKTQGIFFIIYFLYRLGFSQQKLLATYRSLIRQDKL